LSATGKYSAKAEGDGSSLVLRGFHGKPRGTERKQDLPSLALRSTEATKHEMTVSGTGRTLRLEGETTAQFDGGTSQIRNRHVQRASGCDSCDDDRCLRVTGTLVLSYHVTTSVRLPSVNDYPDLTPCQRRRVQDAIDNVLAPHEQEHVRAFETYNGTSEHPFDLRVCNTEQANEQLQAIHDNDAETREANARAASDALDPFHFDVDLDCEDAASEGGDDSGSETTPTEEPAALPASRGMETESAPEGGRAEGPGLARESDEKLQQRIGHEPPERPRETGELCAENGLGRRRIAAEATSLRRLQLTDQLGMVANEL